MSTRLPLPVPKRRPAMLCGVAFALGIWACKAGVLWPLAWVSMLVVTGVHFAARVDRAAVAAFILFSGLGALRCHLCLHAHSPNDVYLHDDSHEEVIFYGRTAGESEIRSNGVAWVFEADSIRHPDSLCSRSGRVLARFKYDPGIRPESKVVLRGRIRPPPEAFNPGDFDWKDYLERRGVGALFEPATGSAVLSTVSAPHGWLSSIVDPLRRLTRQTLVAHLEGEEAALVPGLILGEKETLSPETVDAFQRTGTLHLLAVSGSNVGVVAAAIWGTLLFLRLPRSVRLLLSAVGVLIFCYLAHAEDSVVRATLAGLLVLVGLALRRRPDALNLWGCVLLFMLFAQPLSLFGPGFQLSFGATLGILLVGSHVPTPAGAGPIRSAVKWVAISVVVSLSAQLATLPILAASFNEVPLVTPLSNLLCVPLAGLATLAGLAVLLAAPCGAFLLGALSGTAWLFLKLLLWAVHACRNLEFPVALAPSPSAVEVAIYSLFLWATWTWIWNPRCRRRVCVLGLLGLALALGLELAAPAEPEVWALRGRSLQVLVRLGNGSVWLISGGQVLSRESVDKVCMSLGWGTPDVTVPLKPPDESIPPTASGKPVCWELRDSAVGLETGPLTLILDESDSLPVAVYVRWQNFGIMVSRGGLEGPPEAEDSGSLIWITDQEEVGALHTSGDQVPNRLIFTGKPFGKPGLDSVQGLNTSTRGAVHVHWQNGGFLAEPSIR